MLRCHVRLLLAWTFLALAPLAVRAAEELPYTRTEDVIYGRKYGVALTMDVFTPKENANGAGVVFCVSGGGGSSHPHIKTTFFGGFVKSGYTKFAVFPGRQPKFTIPTVVQDNNHGPP